METENIEHIYKGKKLNGDWVEGFYVQTWREERPYIIPTMFCIRGEVKMNGLQDPTCTFEKVDPNTVSEYINKKDIVGKKIFENDLIEGTFVSPKNKEKLLCKVMRKGDGFVSVDKYGISHKVLFGKDCKVVGNMIDDGWVFDDM